MDPLRYRATAAGEWPSGIHWSPGEERTLPDGYPVPDDGPPAWLEAVVVEVALLVPARRRPR